MKSSDPFSIARSDSSVVIKITGRADCNHTIQFIQILKGEIQRGYRSFILDLSECPLMDSTFLGSLSNEVEKVQADASKAIQVELFDPSELILDNMENLGAMSLFNVLDTEQSPATNFTKVAVEKSTDRVTLLKTSIQAHETLLHFITDPKKRASIEALLAMFQEELASEMKQK